MSKLFKTICSPERNVSCAVLQSVLELAVQIAREGREGKKIGTLFTVGDELNVLDSSRPLILDPLYGHSEKLKQIQNADMRETVKELAQLDGAFVVSNDGVVISAARFLEAPTDGVHLPMGLGTRHMAAMAMSKYTDAVVVVVSTSSVVRVFDDGEIIGEILPELWLINHQSFYVPEAIVEKSKHEQLTVVSKKVTIASD